MCVNRGSSASLLYAAEVQGNKEHGAVLEEIYVVSRLTSLNQQLLVLKDIIKSLRPGTVSPDPNTGRSSDL